MYVTLAISPKKSCVAPWAAEGYAIGLMHTSLRIFDCDQFSVGGGFDLEMVRA